MSEEFLEYQLNQLNMHVNRLGESVDRVCDRILLLEEDLADRNLKKKMINFLLMLYPAVMAFLVLIATSDHQKLTQAIAKTNSIVESVVDLVVS